MPKPGETNTCDRREPLLLPAVVRLGGFDMARPRPVLDVEITVSFRRRAGHLTCAFVTVIETRSDGQRSVVDSRHLCARDEKLIDAGLACVRDMTLEHALVAVEPF